MLNVIYNTKISSHMLNKIETKKSLVHYKEF